MIYVSDLMTEDVFTLKRTDTLSDARELMQLAKIRHLPVVDEDHKFIGLITHRDLLSFAISRFAEIETQERIEMESVLFIGSIMQTEIASVNAQTLLVEAAEILYRNKYGCLPVLDDNGKLTGIITEADFLRLAIALLR